MSRFRGLARTALACVSILISGTHVARAEDAAECSGSYEKSQLLKKNKEYLSARREMLVCARKCRDVAQLECADWLKRLEVVVPSIVIHAEVTGEERSDVKVEMDGKTLATSIHGTGMEVDPGQHEFVFSIEGFRPVRKSLMVHEGEQLRLIHVVFEKPVPSTSLPAKQPTRPEQPVADQRLSATPIASTHIVAYAMGGTGIAAAIVGGIFGAQAISKGHDAKSRCPGGLCDDPAALVEYDDAKADAMRSNIFVGAGGVLLVASAVFFFIEPTSKAHGVSAGVGPGGTTIRWTEHF
jgi:hypothetical protein